MIAVQGGDARPPARFEVKAPAGAPNVVIVLVDDIGFGATSTFGGPIDTPNLDALAQSGLRYNYIAGDNGISAEGGMVGMYNEMTYFNGIAEKMEDLVPLIDKWGGLRSQFTHVIDIAPTILEAAGLPQPKSVNGTVQTPIEGTSMLYTFNGAAAAERHTAQYFEMFGNRAIYNDGWFARTIHRAPWQATGLPEQPDKLEALQALFMKEAEKYHALLIDVRTSLTLYEGMQSMLENTFMNIKNRSSRITAKLDVPARANGAILSQGGCFGGWSLYMKDGKPAYTYNYLGLISFRRTRPLTSASTTRRQSPWESVSARKHVLPVRSKSLHSKCAEGGYMIKYNWMMAVAAIGTLVTSVVMAQAPVVYPAKNQSASQQQKDVAECAAWATQTTGIDPAALAAAPAAAPAPAATPTQAQPTAQRGERVRGAARGAAAGAVIGEIANNDADEGAAVGAAAGAVAAGSRSRRNSRAQQEQAAAQQQQASDQQKAAQQQADAKKQEQLATHGRASNACLEGRGYVVK